MPRQQRRDHDDVLPVMAGERSGAIPPGWTSSRFVVVSAIACVAVGLVVAAVAGRTRGAASIAPGACVDGAARDQITELRRVVMEQAARTTQLARVAERLPTPATAAAPAPRQAAPRQAAPAPDLGPRRYARFEASSDALRVEQRPDGTYDVRTTDPALAGSLARVVAVTASGDEDELIVRIPELIAN